MKNVNESSINIQWMKKNNVLFWLIVALVTFFIWTIATDETTFPKLGGESLIGFCENWYISKVVENFALIKESLPLYLIWLFGLIYLIYKIIIFYSNQYRLTGWMNFVIIIFLIEYLHFRFLHSDCFMPLSRDGSIVYWDFYAFLLFVILGLLPYKWLNLRNSEEKPLLVDDLPIDSFNKDQLGVSSEIKYIANHIKQLNKEKSWSIGLSAPWGSGKTSFVKLIEKYLKSNSEEFVFIWFNPRNSKTEKIQEDFFELLRKYFSKYDARLSRNLREYMRSLQMITKNQWIEKISNGLDIFNKESIKANLNTSFAEINKRIVIIIDDLDRLQEKGILEVFNLLKGNADFKNVIFITAYDRNYVERTIGNNKKSVDTHETSYLDKFFNFQYLIPIVDYDNLHKYMKELIVNRLFSLNENEGNLIVRDMDKVKSILSHYILTMRDAKKFMNIFLIGYLPEKDNLNFHDFMLISLLLFIDDSIYRNIYDKKYLKNYDGRLVYDGIPIIKGFDILEELFPQIQNITQKDYGRIYVDNSFHLYFQRKYKSVYDLNQISTLLRTNNVILTNEEIDDIINYLSTRNTYSYKYEEFIQYIESVVSVIYFTENEKLIDLFYRFLNKQSIENYINTKNISFDDYKKDIIQILEKTGYKSYKFHSRLTWYIQDEYEKNNELVLDKENILEINKHQLKQLCDIQYGYNKLMQIIMHTCFVSIEPETRRVKIDENSLKLVRQKIENNPEFYFEDFVGLTTQSSNPGYNSISCQPYWEELFGNKVLFDQFINDKKWDNYKFINRVRNFWVLFKANNYKPLNFDLRDKNIQDFIDDDLKELLSQYNLLIDIQGKTNVINQKVSDGQKITIEEANNLRYYKDQINNLWLDIPIINSIYNTIIKIISEYPRVYISYSWDNENHKEWVKKLATDLKNKGVDVVIDIWNLKIGQDVPLYMEKGIIDSDKVICILTSIYKKKADDLRDGVGYETSVAS